MPWPRASSRRSSANASGAGLKKTREEARQDVFDYVEMFYNPVRKQVRNGMLSPLEFERQQILKAEGV
jgi:transposase InsO family protein